MDHPSDRKYTKDHEWARLEGDRVRVGITAYAVEQLGDVTLVDLPQANTKLRSGAHFGDIESVKAVSELFAPVSGEVLEVNSELEKNPERVNDSPYEQGWMVVIKPESPTELDALLDAPAYAEFLASLAH
ncbi:MAG TPA: glycine cleavage system protein GcvH [Polyangiales bacterium]|jgi:glycine cleavage system H protein|nr:glycine cleavage system protein GcvH [Polyangiales bacterium]